MKPLNNRLVEITFVVLLLITVGQVIWWIYDQVNLVTEHNETLTTLYQRESIALTNLRADTNYDPTILLPHLSIDNGAIIVTVEEFNVLELSNNSRINRYFWEGGFFLLVLLLSIGIIMRTIYKDRELRRRQQNFIASISHELKTPLASMRLAAESLDLKTTEQNDKKLISRILSEGDRLLHLISNLLDTSKLDENKFVTSKTIFSPASIIKKSINEFSDRFTLNEIKVTYRSDDDLKMTNDPMIYSVIIRNLIENAVKACQQKEYKELTIDLKKQDGKILTIIKDNGIGIESHELDNIFRKFYRIGNENTRSSTGSGLGLYICKKLCQLSDMEIKVESEGLGKGTTFLLFCKSN